MQVKNRKLLSLVDSEFFVPYINYYKLVVRLGTTDESHKSCKVLNGLSTFVPLHVLEGFPFPHERKMTI